MIPGLWKRGLLLMIIRGDMVLYCKGGAKQQSE